MKNQQFGDGRMSKRKQSQRKLSENATYFTLLYAESGNATRAYAKAYGRDIDSEEGKKKNYNSVSVNASKLLKDDRVQKLLAQKEAEMDYHRDLSEKEIIIQLNRMALGTEFRENTRMDALKMLARIKGMYEADERSQAVNINLTSDLQDAINANKQDDE